MKNYLILTPNFPLFRLWREGIAYLDYYDENNKTYNPLQEVKSIIIDKKVATCEDYPGYIVVFASYNKKEKEKVIEAMDRLDKKLTIQRKQEYLIALDHLKNFFNLDKNQEE